MPILTLYAGHTHNTVYSDVFAELTKAPLCTSVIFYHLIVQTYFLIAYTYLISTCSTSCQEV